MKILKLRCRDSEEFDKVFQADDRGGAVFCATTEELAPDSDVVIELICKALPNRVMVRGKVDTWRPALPRLRVRAGATVRFDPGEKNKVDFVVETLQGRRPPAPRRRHLRLPVALPVIVRQGGQAEGVHADLREISVVGGLIGGLPPPPVGSELVMRLTPPGSEAPMDITAKVLYHAGTDGTGLRFLFREGGGARRLRELVRRLKSQ